jgi:hypothetical protein
MGKVNNGDLCDQFGRYLPEGIKHACPHVSEDLCAKPWNRARFIKLVPYPDPPEMHCAVLRCWLRYHNPNFFNEGAIKDYLKVEQAPLVYWRKIGLQKYCKQNKLSISSFPNPAEEPIKPIYAPFGPSNHWIDMMDRRLRADDTTPGGLLKVFAWTFIIGLMGAWLFGWFLFGVFPVNQLAITLIFAVILNWLTNRAANYINHCSDIRRMTYEPKFYIYEKGRLRHLLKNLRVKETELQHYFPKAVISIFKSKPHPNKKGYSLKIVSNLLLNKELSPIFSEPEILTFNIEIVGASVEGPPILCYWFDALKSPETARNAFHIMQFVKERMQEMIDDIREHVKLLPAYHETDPDAEVEYLVWGTFPIRV